MYSPSQLITINIVSWWRAAMIVWNVMINSKVIVVRQMTGWLGLPWSGNIFDKLSKSVKSRDFLFPCAQNALVRQKYWLSAKKPKQIYMCKSGLFFIINCLMQGQWKLFLKRSVESQLEVREFFSFWWVTTLGLVFLQHEIQRQQKTHWAMTFKR